MGIIAVGCATTTPDFEDVPPAEELYADGLETLEGRRILYLFTYVDYDSAIERFQSIIVFPQIFQSQLLTSQSLSRLEGIFLPASSRH